MPALAVSNPSVFHHHNHTDLVSVLRSHAAEQPDQIAFNFLLDGQTEGVITFRELDRRARALAVSLQEISQAGQRVLLVYPPGMDFIAGFFGCLYASCVAVPTYLPHRRTLARLLAVATDAETSLALSTAACVAQYQTMTGQTGGDSTDALPIQWLAADAVPDAMADQWRRPVISPDTLAMLQYTSGSTSQPKGVMLSHANLIHNTRAILEAFGLGKDTGLFWLPTYHDMGLIGGVLAPILAGGASVFMPPAAFLQDPFAWLSAISERRATISGGPGFAFDLCVRRITPEQRATLDLSCWKLAFIGAEPIRPETLDRFADAFASCGFNRSAFYPCYGLAEATLMVSGAVRGAGPTVRSFDNSALAEHRVKPMADGAGTAKRLVSCGTAVDDVRVTIVDPQTGIKAATGKVGEIWVAGPSVGQGYWQKPELTRQTFAAILTPPPTGSPSLESGEDRFLRTGDLGFVFEGELYVVGRRDDVLIVRGSNHHPQDLETTARGSHRLLEAGCGAAFSVEDAAGPRLVLVHEVARGGDTDFTPALSACREAVLAEHGLALHAIVLVRSGTVPKTSSGKVQRRACRTAFLAGELKAVASYQAAPPTGIATSATTATVVASAPEADAMQNDRTRGALPSTPGSVANAQGPGVFAAVCQHALALGGSALSAVTPETSLAALGLDSLQRVQLAAALERTFSCHLPDSEVGPAQTLGELAHAVEKHLGSREGLDASASQTPVERIPPEHYDFARFPEYGELKRYERMLMAVAGNTPYFRVDEGGTPTAATSRIAGHELLNFSVYDYIGLSRHSEVAGAARTAIDRYGTSAGASRLVSGEKRVHRDLEQAIASFLGTAAALVFVSGHATNVTTIGHLLGPEDLIVYDALAHNSIIQGAQLSGATRRAFAHNDDHALDLLLSQIRHRYRRVLIAIEGVYSMDGDFPDVPRFIAVKKKHKALMLIDEAHSLGTMGRTGRGIGEHFATARTDVDLWMGTLSKSLASCGGYIAGSAEMVEYLAYTAPGFVYSVGISPANAASALAALTVLKAEPGRVSQLRDLSALFLCLAKERALNTGDSAGTPVIPMIIGNSVKTLRLARALFDRGINVQPILPPAVPEQSARLRFFITINHTEVQIRAVVDLIAEELARL